MPTLQLDTKEFWEALTMQGKAKALRAIDCHPRLCTADYDALPALVKRKLEKLWHEHGTITLTPNLEG